MRAALYTVSFVVLAPWLHALMPALVAPLAWCGLVTAAEVKVKATRFTIGGLGGLADKFPRNGSTLLLLSTATRFVTVIALGTTLTGVTAIATVATAAASTATTDGTAKLGGQGGDEFLYSLDAVVGAARPPGAASPPARSDRWQGGKDLFDPS